MTLPIFFRNFLRPKVTSVNVEIYENKKLKDLTTYTDLQISAIEKSIQVLFVTEPKSPYWFEVETFEHWSCFQRRPPTMVVTCYTKDMTANGFKSKYAIPIKYRKKMFDSAHILCPDIVGGRTWPLLEARFRLKE